MEVKKEVTALENPAISIVLATRGDKIEFLTNCIKSLKKQTFRNFEIIVVSKNFPTPVESLFDDNKIRFIKEKGKTLGAARNLGVKNAKGNLVSFIDDDAEAPVTWLSNIFDTFNNFPSLCCLGGPHYTPKDEAEKKPLRLVEGSFGEAHLQKISLGKAAIGKIAGCNVTYKTSVFQERGYLDESLRTCEDWEFNRRLLKNGCALRFDPKIWVYHHRQGLKHVFQGATKSAPFYLSWSTIKLLRYDSLIASFYGAHFIFIVFLIVLFISPYTFLAAFLLALIAYITYAAVKTKTYNRKILYFPLILLFTLTRIIGFYFGAITYVNSKLQSVVVHSS